MALTLERTHTLFQGCYEDSEAFFSINPDRDINDYLSAKVEQQTDGLLFINKLTVTDREGDAPIPSLPYLDTCVGLGWAHAEYYFHYDEYGTLILEGPFAGQSQACARGGAGNGGFYRPVWPRAGGEPLSAYVCFSHISYYLDNDGHPQRSAYYGTHAFIDVISDHSVEDEVFMEEECQTHVGMPDNPDYFQILPALSESAYLTSRGIPDTFASLQQFLFLIEAIPAPYAVRIPPDTTIWLRLRDPDYPLDSNTLIFTVNGADVTSSIQITHLVNGMELLYDPPVDFEYGERVTVSVSLSSDFAQTTTFSGATVPSYDYIGITDSATILQVGYVLRLGPNALGQSELNEVVNIVGTHTIQVLPMTNEYSPGDTITYYSPDTNRFSINYWFEIIDDYRPPWVTDIYPEAEATGVSPTTYISFHLWDLGLGIDISSLVFRVNNIDVYPEITKYSDNHYYVYYQADKAFYYNAYVHCFIQIYDLSEVRNYTVEFWRFQTSGPQNPLIQNFDPYECEYDVPLSSDVSVDVYGRDSGLDLANLLITIDEIEYDYELWPELYRPSEEEEIEE